MNATTFTKSQILTRVGALSLAIDEGQLHTHIFDWCSLPHFQHTKPNPHIAELVLDAADHCENCRQDLDSFLKWKF